MNLYSPDAVDFFVFAVVANNAKEGSATEYKAAPGPDMETAFQRNLGMKYKMAAPHCMGRFDHLGRYMTYQPPVEGIRPGKFILHPLADAEYIAQRAY